MESQPQNPEFRNNPENFHPCLTKRWTLGIQKDSYQLTDWPTFESFATHLHL